jgi:DNA-binding HxlR family transcriptional regulator
VIIPVTPRHLGERDPASSRFEKRSDTRPPGVQYGLTPGGQALVPVLEQVADWAEDHLG